ncbi:MAG: lipid-A-disaccharide synthase [Saprospiraceae bacterium]|nr:lipid-A-disaccharide synthase [Saprospiraceae bacterium]
MIKLDPEAQIRAWGGDLMKANGATLVKHYKDLAFMGIWAVIKKLPSILRNLKLCRNDILDFNTDALILIDYSGFNLRIAKWAKINGFKVFYYISPQVWATRENRVKKIKRYVDKMFVILPFEKEFYKKHNYNVEYVGHPLLDVINVYKSNPDFYIDNNLTEKPIIALLPGSRKQEIKAMLKIMTSIVNHFESYQFIIAGAPSVDKCYYENFLFNNSNILFLENQTYDLLNHSHAALVTSGTATLETAIFEVPQVVCYKTNPIFYRIVKKIIKVVYISIVNLIMEKKVVPELIQNDFNKVNLIAELNKILLGTDRINMIENYILLKEKLGKNGASKKTANIIYKLLKNNEVDCQ